MRTGLKGLYWGTNEMGGQWELCNQSYIGGPMRWGTNDNCINRVTSGGPMRWGINKHRYKGLHWGTNEMGDQWELCNQGNTGAPMGWGTIENCVTRVTFGDRWDRGPGNESCVTRVTLGDQWDGDQCELCNRGYIRDQWDGGPMNTDIRVYSGGPLRWGTSGMGDNWVGPKMGGLMKRVSSDKDEQCVQAM